MILISSQNQKAMGVYWACEHLKIPVLIWDIQALPVLDAVAVYKPNLMIIDSAQDSRAFLKARHLGYKVLVVEDIPPLANTVLYKPGMYRKELECDLLIIGKQPDEIVEPLLYPLGKYNIKIFGNYRWREVIQYLGNINQKDFSDACVSASFVLNFSDDQCLTYNIMAAGGIPVIKANEENLIFFNKTLRVWHVDNVDMEKLLENTYKNMPHQGHINFAMEHSYIEYVKTLPIY